MYDSNLTNQKLKKNLNMIPKLYFYIYLALAGCASTSTGSDLQTLTCKQHFEISQKANQFGARNFDKIYSNDPEGAEVQLFLIQQKAPSNFAANYNAAEVNFNKHLKAAKEKKCDVSNYPSSPISEFENKLNALKASRKK